MSLETNSASTMCYGKLVEKGSGSSKAGDVGHGAEGIFDKNGDPAHHWY